MRAAAKKRPKGWHNKTGVNMSSNRKPRCKASELTKIKMRSAREQQTYAKVSCLYCQKENSKNNFSRHIKIHKGIQWRTTAQQ